MNMENLIESPNKKTENDGEEKKKRPVIKSATDLQRLKLEKLMKNPDKPIIIPEPPKEKDYMQTVPSFVRNVMGSSAGAGSGEFHVYRHLRRKEYARQKCIQAKSIREQLDDEYQSKLEKNRFEAEAKTAKKRAKRLKKKQRAKKPKTKQNEEEKKPETSEEEEDEDDEDENRPGNEVSETVDEAEVADEATVTVSVEKPDAKEETDKAQDKLQGSPKSEDVVEDKHEDSADNEMKGVSHSVEENETKTETATVRDHQEKIDVEPTTR